MTRRLVSIATLVIATLVLVLRVRDINTVEPVVLAPRTMHLLYLDSLRRELLTFAEQYGRPVFQYDTTSPVTGHGRIQLWRLRHALFDPRIEYVFGDEGFAIDWRGDPKPRTTRSFTIFGASHVPLHSAIGDRWPQEAAEYARLRRLFITPQWPEPPVRRRSNRSPATGVPPHADAYSILALATQQ
jgi:hypothetical protein